MGGREGGREGGRREEEGMEVVNLRRLSSNKCSSLIAESIAILL